MGSTASVAVPYPGKVFPARDKEVIKNFFFLFSFFLFKLESSRCLPEAVGPAVALADVFCIQVLLIIMDTRGL